MSIRNQQVAGSGMPKRWHPSPISAPPYAYTPQTIQIFYVYPHRSAAR